MEESNPGIKISKFNLKLGKFEPANWSNFMLQSAIGEIGCFWAKAPNSMVKFMRNLMCKSRRMGVGVELMVTGMKLTKQRFITEFLWWPQK
jgi:hypothetical protein